MTTSVNVSTVVVANTFDQWRIQTNLLKDDVNEIARGDFVKPTGNVTLTVGRLVLPNATGTMLDVTADARVSGKVSLKNFEQDGGTSYFYSDSKDIKFRAADGTLYANGNTRTVFLYNNTFFSATNINATGFIQTTGTYANANLIMNVGGVLTVRSSANSSNVYVVGNISVSNVATIGNAQITLANITTLNASTIVLSTANVTTLNVNTTGAQANIKLANIANLFTANAIVTTANITSLMNATTANIGTLYVTSLSVTDPITAPSESDSDLYRLRVAQATRGIGTFGVFQGTTNGNAALRFTTTGNVWELTANDKQTWATIITTANVQSTYSTDSANAASLTIVKGANDNAISALVAANSAANTVRVSANSGSTITKANGVNFVNTATVSVAVESGTNGNANVSFAVIGGMTQGATGAQGTTGTQGTSGSNGSQGTTGIQGTAGVLGGDGSQGATGTQGTVGTTGSQGTTGTQGTTGIRGYNGGTLHEFTTGSQADSDPGNGVFKFNNVTIGSVTFIYIDQLDYLGVDRASYYLSFDDSNSSTNRGLITLGSSGVSTDAATFRVTGTVISGSGYYKIPVAYVSGTMPTNGAVMSLIFTATGAQGTTGSQGTTGTQGTNGTTGSQGPAGTSIQGAIGSQGTTGTQGATGIQGTNGTQGTTGTQGTSGATLSGGNNTYLAKWSSTTTLGYGTAYESGGTVYSTDFSASSDARLKTIIGFVDNAVEKVESLNAVRYRWNDLALNLGYSNDHAPELGVLAQEVQTVIPEAVTMGDRGYLSVSYDRLVPVLIEAVKELNARIKVLEGK